MATKQDLDWSFGLKCHTGKYLTAEAFGDRLNATAGSMKKKQIFFLETDASDAVHIRAHSGKYLRVDGDGKLCCDNEAKTDESELLIEAQPDGRWALKSKKYNWFIGGSKENLTAFTKEIEEEKLWTVHLAMHPMITLNNVMRKAYVHLSDAGNSLTTDELIPWGHDAVLELEFLEDGSYGIKGSNGKYLRADGALSADGAADKDTHFVIEFQGGQVSFKAKENGKYLTSLGAQGLCKATKSAIGKDEQYVMENSYPQVALTATNGKFASIKQGTELAATATEVSDLEIFQLEPQGGSAFKMRTQTGYIGATDAYCGVISDVDVAVADDSAGGKVFNVEWHGSKIALKASNGKYLSQKMNKYISAVGDSADEASLFTFTLVNRPRIAFRGEFGFVNVMPSGLLECNKSSAEIFELESNDGSYAIKSSGGKYWKVGENGVSAVGDAAEYYTLELQQNSKLAIKTDSGMYFQSAQNGAFTAKGAGISEKELFEY